MTMGEIADQIVDRMIFGGFERPGKKRRRTYQSGVGDFMWRTKTGEELSMWDMDTQHLRNAAKMCASNGNTGKAKQLRKVLYERDVRA
jgi:hypothetical protein